MGPVKLEKLGMVHVFPFTTPLNIDPDLRRCGVGLVFVFSTKFGRHLRTMISTLIQILNLGRWVPFRAKLRPLG